MRQPTLMEMLRNVSRHPPRWLTGVLLLFVVHVASNHAEASVDKPTETAYHGFQVDDHLISGQQRADFLPYLSKQLEIVESVGLPADVVEFFKGVLIVVDPALRSMPGRYDNFDGRWVVMVQPIPMSDQTPIVLHELLHAYHHRVLTLQNADIVDAYQRAKQSGWYPSEFRSAHFLENRNEFFAVIGSIYLFHKIKQPPYDCTIPARTDPQFLAFLGKVLGPHVCN